MNDSKPFILFKENDALFYAQFPDIRKEPILDDFFEIDNPAITKQLDAGNVWLGHKTKNGVYYYEKPASNKINVYWDGCGLSFDDPLLGIVGEAFAPSVEKWFDRQGLLEKLRSNNSSACIELASRPEATQFEKTYSYILEFVSFSKQSEDGVLYRDIVTEETLWFCSCFRCYFNILHPPKFIGINIDDL